VHPNNEDKKGNKAKNAFLEKSEKIQSNHELSLA